MMWCVVSRLMMSTMAASVVVLPWPVGPVTTTRPWWWCVARSISGGSPSDASVGTPAGMKRKHALRPVRWRDTLTRKRPEARSSAKSHEPCAASVARARSGTRSRDHGLDGGFVDGRPSRQEIAADAHEHGTPGDDVQIAGGFLARHRQELIETRRAGGPGGSEVCDGDTGHRFAIESRGHGCGAGDPHARRITLADRRGAGDPDARRITLADSRGAGDPDARPIAFIHRRKRGPTHHCKARLHATRAQHGRDAYRPYPFDARRPLRGRCSR